MVEVESTDTVPEGFSQGAEQVTEKVAVSVIGAIASLKVAVTAVIPTGTPVIFATGLTALTTGLTTATAPGARIGSRSEPHPANKALDRMAVSHTRHPAYLMDWRTISPNLSRTAGRMLSSIKMNLLEKELEHGRLSSGSFAFRAKTSVRRRT